MVRARGGGGRYIGRGSRRGLRGHQAGQQKGPSKMFCKLQTQARFLICRLDQSFLKTMLASHTAKHDWPRWPWPRPQVETGTQGMGNNLDDHDP